MMDLELDCNSALCYIMEKDDSSSSNSHEKVFSPSSPPSLKKQSNLSIASSDDYAMMKEQPSSFKDAECDDVDNEDDDASAGSFPSEVDTKNSSEVTGASGVAAAAASSPSKKAANLSFPVKLYEMLEDAETEGFDHIVSWLPCGTALKVHSQEKFAKEGIMSRYFKQTRYKSFQKQLNLYKFQRTPDGARKGSYSHELFRRGKKEQCKLITRAKLNQSSRNINNERGMLQNQDLVSSVGAAALPSRPLIESQNNHSSQGFAPEDLLFGGGGRVGTGILISQQQQQHQQQQQQLVGGMNFFTSSDSNIAVNEDGGGINNAAALAPASAAAAVASIPTSNILSNIPSTTSNSNNNLPAVATWQGNPNVSEDIIDEIILTFGNGMNPSSTF